MLQRGYIIEQKETQQEDTDNTDILTHQQQNVYSFTSWNIPQDRTYNRSKNKPQKFNSIRIVQCITESTVWRITV